MLGITVLILSGCQSTATTKSHTASSQSSVVKKATATPLITTQQLRDNNKIKAAAVLNYGAKTIKSAPWRTLKSQLTTPYTLHKTTVDNLPKYTFASKKNSNSVSYVASKNEIMLYTGEKKVTTVSLADIVAYINRHFTMSTWTKVMTKASVATQPRPKPQPEAQQSQTQQPEQAASSSVVQPKETTQAESASTPSAATTSSSSSAPAQSSSSETNTNQDDSSGTLTRERADAVMREYYQSVYHNQADGYNFDQLVASQESDSLWLYKTPDGKYFWWVSEGGVISPRQNAGLLK
ncbi:hypothetical protein [Lacticaseibacillus saniviri]